MTWLAAVDMPKPAPRTGPQTDAAPVTHETGGTAPRIALPDALYTAPAVFCKETQHRFARAWRLRTIRHVPILRDR
jgi:hypothetical protein